MLTSSLVTHYNLLWKCASGLISHYMNLEYTVTGWKVDVLLVLQVQTCAFLGDLLLTLGIV